MQSYPKWLYHPSKPAALVADETERKALGAGWAESPADVSAEPPPEKAPEPKHHHHAKKTK